MEKNAKARRGYKKERGNSDINPQVNVVSSKQYVKTYKYAFKDDMLTDANCDQVIEKLDELRLSSKNI